MGLLSDVMGNETLSSGLANMLRGKTFGGNTRKRDRRRTVTPMQEFRRGGKVRRTGLAKVHKGEHILTRRQARARRRPLRRRP